jgi:asparagine synthase (glutamine-hydrolysing)
MSGIVGIYRRDGAPADRGLIEALTRFLSYVGPDARNSWINGGVALGHSLLITTRDAERESQPLSLGKLTLVADARIDARAELAQKLADAGHPLQPNASDAEYILHAHAAWGRDCVRHLQGDFAFAVWDAERKTLFCGRDHFGVKPFYYSEIGPQVVFSNVLDCLRLHPDVSSDLNDAALADFLLFGLNCDVRATSFRKISRLPPAHTLTVSPAGVAVERYWSAPTNGHIRYKDPREYAHHFQEVFHPAVADRMRSDRVGLLMSGGLDSATVAATACNISHAAAPGAGSDLHAFTMVYESLFADDEGRYARELAQFLKLPIECVPLDSLKPFEGWAGAPAKASNDREGSEALLRWPEPVDDPFMAGLFVQFNAIANTCRVALTGDGGDNLMHFEMWPYAKSMMRSNQWTTLARQMPSYLRRRNSPIPGAVRRVRKVLGAQNPATQFPKWISAALVEKLKLKQRATEWQDLTPNRPHPVLPRGHASLSLPQWPNLFEMQNAGVTKSPVELRHPFLDLRVVNFLLSLPSFPLYMEKKLLRDVLVARVPESVRTRKKTPLAGDDLQQHLRQPDMASLNNVAWVNEIDAYVDTAEVERVILQETKIYNSEPKFSRINAGVRPICLNFWLQSMRIVRYNLHAEARNG